MALRIFTAAACAAALAIASASAQDKPVRIRGTVEQMDGQMMTIKARSGEMLKVKLADDGKVVALVKASLADIKPGSFVGSTAMPEQDGSWKAVEVHIFPEAMRGTGEGDRAYDYKPKSTMTNGTVDASVAKVSGSTMTLKYKEGEKKIDVTPETVIVMYAPGNKDELKPGAQIIIMQSEKQADGSFLAKNVYVGRGLTPAM